ncbi:MAG: hybrid sensor histidine kinase/response regulator [Bacteroidetes bacterium GWE2_39_28]|nr:MAG: hybrid sensor histidine kinase/response regulator [Bacteroidetes bacterium GWE2_39_28]OFY13570.1 MAG: hybrid sensor histidine kinase/response regulator [Bacteroidetes bacterium GWF2_39_10]OFZ07342.1 MAG: hybrid sensor histidine kinase/response regulator [Bacteroidetes bacterium RIFOXYB2_FULL_39_7]OFZ11729.1 MAG: hybrid sensor histidine kinase/response regulator [Bacteroidetes bacterium RIFOXYC2_FULL_39_11]HCT94908.1 hybrid sensor histidine kinase/response regulator [Rikenellaceae bacter
MNEMDFKNSDFTVLIVDDVDANVLLLKLLISKAGYKTISAYNGKDALEIVMEQSPDLILLDIMMPVMDGHQVAKKLKEIPEKAEIPIIFLSALNSTDDIVQGFKLGAADYVSKPFNKDELLTRINHQISLIAAKRTISRQTEELRKTILGRDKLYSVIAHDLRSPIASIRMVMEVLINGITKESIDPDMYDLLIMANRLTDDSFTLLDNLLKWTKSQTGRLNSVFQDDVEIMNLVTGVVEVLRGVAKLKNIEISLLGSSDRIARIDIDMAKTALRNLLSNAIKFSFDGSRIEVKITEEDSRVIVAIKDYGAGISEEKQKLLFKADTHFTSFGTGNEEGSGLGLLLCNEFVSRNGGKLWFVSEEGKGSTFSFDIPTPKK